MLDRTKRGRHYLRVKKSKAQLFAALDREQPVQFGLNGDVTGGCSRPVSFPLGAVCQMHFMRNKMLVSVLFAGIVAFFVVGCASHPAGQSGAISLGTAPLPSYDTI